MPVTECEAQRRWPRLCMAIARWADLSTMCCAAFLASYRNGRLSNMESGRWLIRRAVHYRHSFLKALR